MNSNSNNIINLLYSISNKFSENKNINEIQLSKLKREFLIDYSLNQNLISETSIDDDDFYFKKNIIMSMDEVNELRKNLLGNKTNRFNNENPNIIINNETNKNLVSYKNGKIKIQQEEEDDKKIENNNNDIIKLNHNVTFIYLFIFRFYQ